MVDVILGGIEYGVPDIIPNVVVDAPNGTFQVLAGETIPFPTRSGVVGYGVCDRNKLDGEIVSIGVNKHYRVTKKTGAALAVGDRIKFSAVASPKNNYEAEICVSTNLIDGYVMKAAASGDTTVHIWGPIWPPNAKLAP